MNVPPSIEAFFGATRRLAPSSTPRWAPGRRCGLAAPLAVVAALILGAPRSPSALGQELPPAATVKVDFLKDIEPILSTKCQKCHGPEKQKSEYRLDSREAAIKGGETGVAIVPGKSAESALIRYVAGLDPDIKMPPSKADALSAEQVGILRAWIDQDVVWAEKVVEAKAPREWRPLEGQKTWATSLAFAPNGSTLAVGGGYTLIFKPGEVHLWDLKDGKEEASLAGHTSTVWSVAFDAKGQRLATASYDKEVRLWDVASKKELAVLKGHANWVTSVAFSPAGDLVATGSEDMTVKLWDAASAAEKATLKGHAGTVRSLAFSHDGAILASAGFDGAVKLWDVAKATELASLAGHEGAVWAVAFAPGSDLLASAGADGTIRLWRSAGTGDLAQRAALTEAAVLKGHKNWVSCLAFSLDGRQLVSGGFDRSVLVWDLTGGSPTASLEGLAGTVWSVSYTPDGASVAIATSTSAEDEATVKFWPVPRAF